MSGVDREDRSPADDFAIGQIFRRHPVIVTVSAALPEAGMAVPVDRFGVPCS